MKYETGSFSSGAELKSIIEQFADSNGWDFANGVITKKEIYIKLSLQEKVRINNINYTLLLIQGAKTQDFSADITNGRSGVSIASDTEGSTTKIYHIFCYNDPEMIWVSIQYDTVKFQHMGFGEIIKYGTWDGGTFFHGSVPYPYGNYTRPIIPRLFFTSSLQVNQGENLYPPSQLLCNVDGKAWITDNNNPGLDVNRNWWPGISTMANTKISLLSPIDFNNQNNINKSINQFNNQKILRPFVLFAKKGDFYFPVGCIKHIRDWVYMKDNEPLDTIEVGSEKFKIMPWSFKGNDMGWGETNYYPEAGMRGIGLSVDE